MRVPARRFAAALLMLATLAAAADAPTFPQVAKVSAFLLNSRTGQLSGDVIGRDDLGNVPAGPLASVSTLVVVRIAFGPDGALPPPAARLRLVATVPGPRGGKGARVLLDQAARLGPVAQDGTTHVGFWLPDTGCRPVTLRATLTGAARPAAARAELGFACYE
jgi:hypothetical protein